MSDNKEVFLKFVTSCTKDEAVGRMLGWMQGPIYDAEPELTEDNNVPLEYLPYLSSLPNSLEKQLTYLVGEAQEELNAAKDSGAEPEVIRQKETVLSQSLEWIDKAGIYLADIVDEFAKGETSALRIDQEATDKFGVIHITIKSLKDWALDVYKLPTPHSFKSTPEIGKQLSDSQNKKRESTTKIDNLYITFAFLIEAFIKDKPKYSKGNKVNVSQMAEFISGLTIKEGKRMEKQGAEAIKQRIEDSMRKKEELF